MCVLYRVFGKDTYLNKSSLYVEEEAIRGVVSTDTAALNGG